jgi:membrane protein YqaA with SNARE-associated domain
LENAWEILGGTLGYFLGHFLADWNVATQRDINKVAKRLSKPTLQLTIIVI